MGQCPKLESEEILGDDLVVHEIFSKMCTGLDFGDGQAYRHRTAIGHRPSLPPWTHHNCLHVILALLEAL